MTRKHKRHKKAIDLEKAQAPARSYYVLPDGTMTKNEARAAAVVRAGGVVRSVPRLGDARILPVNDGGPQSTWVTE